MVVLWSTFERYTIALSNGLMLSSYHVGEPSANWFHHNNPSTKINSFTIFKEVLNVLGFIRTCFTFEESLCPDKQVPNTKEMKLNSVTCSSHHFEVGGVIRTLGVTF